MATEIHKHTAPQPFYSIPQAAKILSVSRVTVFNWVTKGKLKSLKIGKNYIIPTKDLSLFKKSKTYLNRKKSRA